MELTQRERTVLAAVCDTLFPGIPDGPELYRRSASSMGVDTMLSETISHSLQPENARDFRRILSAFDSSLYNLVLTGKPTKFLKLDAPEREAYLMAWRDSGIALKRTAFQALKRLTLFLAYASVDGAGSNPNWSEIGYPGPSHEDPVPTPAELRLHPMKFENDTKLTCDVVVVGSGAGGSVIADELSQAGYEVVVVEQGPYETSETFEQNEMMMQKLFQQSGTAATKDLSFVLLAGRGAGGGTTVNWNTCLRPPSRILKEWESEYGITEVTGPEFQAHVEDAWNGLGVNAGESQVNGNNQVLLDGCKELGYAESQDYRLIERNAVGCNQRCDYCTYGCIYAAKQSTALTYLPSAEKRGARFLFDSRVERVNIEAGQAKGVVAHCQTAGRPIRLEVSARAVVVACGGIETPALLLRSGVKDKNVGNYLRLDPTVAVGGIFEKKIMPWRGPPQTVAVWKFIDLDGTYHGFWIEAAPAHPGLFALSIPWVSGRHHKDFMLNYYSHSSATIVLLRESGWGRVSIDREGYPAVSYDLASMDKQVLIRGMEETAKILAAAGATGVWTTHNSEVFAGDGRSPVSQADLDRFGAALRKEGISYNKMMLYSAHLMGSCRMSGDPSKGPTAPNGELHTVKNLYIGDASVFPTTPGVNPMITIMAMAKRTAESIKMALGGSRESPHG